MEARKNLSVFAILLFLVLFITSGSEKMVVNADAQCEKPLHGGGCQKDECNSGCVAKYGAGAYGYCFFFQKPNDTCVCRYHC
ncbi:hypothetical protein NC652_033717 [Populus alba x Populus x berolinensis]|nr:hypothetical protein NC652_033717 [Populus alba x Populus x berolinensis]